MIELFDPTGDIRKITVSRPDYPRSLKGVTVGGLENTKHNAEFILSRAIEELVDGADAVRGPLLRKDFSSVGATPEMLDHLMEQCGFVLVGTAD